MNCMLMNSTLNKKVWFLAWPAILQLSFQTTVGMITMVFVGNISPEGLAAVGLAQRVLLLMIGVLSALTVGTTALVAQYTGAGNPVRARQIATQSITVGVAAAAVLAVITGLWSEKIIALMMVNKPDTEVIRLGGEYLRLVGFALVVEMPLLVINGALQGAGDTKTPMYFVIGMNFITLLAGYLLIFGPGFLPAMGIKGAGLAEALARSIAGIVALLTVFGGKLRLKLKMTDLGKWQPELMQEILRIGLPSSGENLVRQLSMVIYTMLVASLGTAAIAANQIAMSVFSLSFMPGFGFSLAATTLVGQSLGAGDERKAEEFGWGSNFLGSLLMGILGVGFYFLAHPLAALYSNSLQVQELAAKCIKVIAFAQVPFAAVMILSGGLRGAGDAKYVMYTTIISQCGIRLLLSFMALWLGYGLVGIWVAMLVDSVTRGWLTARRFKSGRWKEFVKINNVQNMDTLTTAQG